MSTLEHSKYYHIELHEPWNLQYDFYVVGTVSKLTIQEIEDINLRSKYFTEYGLGLATYLNIVKNNTPIYFGYLISSKSPVIIDDKGEKIFIPQTMINFNKTYEYLVGYKPKFTLNINPRYFNFSINEQEFINDSKNVIINALNSTEKFIADIISIDYTSETILMTQNEIDIFNINKDSKLEFIKQAKLQEKINEEARMRELYEKKLLAEESRKNYEQRKLDYDRLINDLASEQLNIQNENRILNEIRTIMITIIEKIKNGELNPSNFPSFQEIYNSVKNNL